MEVRLTLNQVSLGFSYVVSTVVLLSLSVITPAPELPVLQGPEASPPVQSDQVDRLDALNVYHSDDSDDSELDPSELEVQAKLKSENAAYRRGIIRNLTEATQLAIETETLELQIQKLERDLARDEDLYRRLKKRSKRSSRRKRLTKSTTNPSLPPKGPRRRFHRR